LHYAQVANYFVGVTNGPIGANTFRLLYKPDFSGEQAFLRRYIFGGGGYATGNSFLLYNSDDTDGPRALFTRGGAINLSLAFNDFVWDANTWYYMGVSFDSTGGTFYMRAMTNGAIANIQTAAFVDPTWSDSGLASGSVNVGISQSNTEGAQGQIDDLKVFSNERWSASDFAFDFALIIPEPSTILLVAAGLGTLALRKPRSRV
jgi:hypothetical protein